MLLPKAKRRNRTGLPVAGLMEQQAGNGRQTPLRLVIGLGNPGSEYRHTRHNLGARFVEALAVDRNCPLRRETRFHGRVARWNDLFLLVPSTWMNESGRAVAALARYHKLQPGHLLVAHDELDLPPGDARFKQGGGHGGHKGLRDIAAALGSSDFYRLRLGIGHPGPGDHERVTRYVLSAASKRESELQDAAFSRALAALPNAVSGHWEAAMQCLHTRQAGA